MTDRAGFTHQTGLTLALCLALSLATGLIWELQNDEGVSFSVSVGELHLSGESDANPTATRDVYAMIDGRDDMAAVDVIEALRNPEQMTHPPGFYLGLNAWSSVAGTRTLVQRLPAYLLGLLSVLAIGVLARRLVGTTGAAAAAMALMAAAPWFHGVTNFLRPYSPALCLGLWATVALASARPGPLRAPWRVAFVLLSAAGLYVVYHYAFVLVWHGVALLVLAVRAGPGRRLPELLRLSAMTAAVALLFSPWVPTLLEHMAVTGDGGYFWKDPTAYDAPWPRAGRLLQRMFLGEVHNMWGSGFFAPALALLSGLTALLAVRSFRRAGRRSWSPAAGVVWATAPVYPALVVAADLTRGASTAFITKYVFMLFPLLLLLLVRAGACDEGLGVGDTASSGGSGTRRVPATLSGLVLSAWLALLLAATATDLVMRSRLDSDHEVVARVVAEADEPGQLVLLSSIESRFAVPLVLTLREAGVASSSMAYARGEALTERVSAALADPDVRRVVLVRFDGTTPKNPNITTHAYDETWTPARLAQVENAARAAGWEVRRGPARDGPPRSSMDVPNGPPSITGKSGGSPSGALAERVLTLIDGVRTKRFHGHY